MLLIVAAAVAVMMLVVGRGFVLVLYGGRSAGTCCGHDAGEYGCSAAGG